MGDYAYAVETVDLVKNYGSLVAVDHLNLRIRKGEVYSLLGPNGAGKTTTIEMLEGMRKRTSGDIRILGLDPWKNAQRIRRKVGIIPQDFNFMGKIKPGEAIRHYCRLFGIPDRSGELLELVDLRDMSDMYFERLSGGQKQKLGLCLALVNNPELIFLDEPTTGLDPQARRNMWEVIRKLRSEGRTILLTTHYLEEAEMLADRVGIVNHGRMIAEGSPADIIREHGSGRVLSINGDAELARDISAATGRECISENGIIDIRIKDNSDIIEILKMAASRGNDLSRLELRQEGLEDVFVRMVGKVEAD
ncbi:MAG: ABC transporter ATP-binding protein [Thermoplasmata archaeon]|uniref:ABC transporter ATP-binding protein n=1 Tax=Candidatus Sysuiplasma superficiale TaxID=2823368 RepID=A0A8J7YJ00_9ARCH|nr:ABC transporter ATP-binding protein [Candidatus Sysuiplasma superficiale]MBX8643572.1 ABC transporter ATP-binding protein [Candidatus Sysuiplasma superficiale]MCL4346953.1 ABC transporter ATP-binding protein [Candidatus Thermoplasmatota archaeon]MCL5437512.1 ABC transporter ATP-binding protein [Candidatus Thermoplasmatota archaeon]